MAKWIMKKISRELERVEKLIDDFKYNEGILLLLREQKRLEKFGTTYEALDKAQISLENNRLMKAVSELNEAKFNLKDLKIGKKYIKEIDNKLKELRERLGRTPDKDDKKEEQVFEIEEQSVGYKTI